MSKGNFIKNTERSSTQSIQERQLRRRGKQNKKIIITNHYRGKERNRPRIQRMKEKRNELINGCFFVLELSIVALPPQAPLEATKDHIPHNRTPRATTRPPTSK
jgi:hypothetical protein